MNEQHFGRRIRESLEHGLDVDPAVAARLKLAREHALERHHAAEPVFVLAWAGRLAERVGGPSFVFSRVLLPMAVLIAGLAGITYYHQQYQQQVNALARQAAEIEEIDAGLLTGDLPIKAYLDEDFQAWLKRSSD